MKQLRLAALITCVAGTPGAADVQDAVASHILPGFAQFATATAQLDTAAQADCRPALVQPAFHAAFDAWMAVGDLRIGPSETGALSIAFWPDDRGFTARALSGLIASADPIVHDPVAFADVSIAARGVFALEMLLHDPAFADYDPQDFTCDLVRAITTDLARQAAALDLAWSDGFARTLTTSGTADNATYLDADEAVRAVYTQILASLEMTAANRLGRPMATFDRPRPRLAEAWRSGRSLRNVVLAVEAAHALAHALSDTALPGTDAALSQLRAAVANVGDPGFQDVTDPQARLRVEVVQQAVTAMHLAIQTEIGAALGIAPGFNAQDGD